MVLTILIGLWLVGAVIQGWQRGLTATVITLVSSVLVWGAAFFLRTDVAQLLAGNGPITLGNEVLAFSLILIVGYMATHFLLMLAQAVKWIPVIREANSLGGALLSGLFNYGLVFVALSLALMLDTPWIQQQFDDSKTAQAIVTKTPLLSQNTIQNWLENDARDATQPSNSTSDTVSSSTSASTPETPGADSQSRDINAAPADVPTTRDSWWQRATDWLSSLW